MSDILMNRLLQFLRDARIELSQAQIEKAYKIAESQLNEPIKDAIYTAICHINKITKDNPPHQTG